MLVVCVTSSCLRFGLMKLTRRTREKNVMALQVARKLKLLWKPEGVRLNSFSPPQFLVFVCLLSCFLFFLVLYLCGLYIRSRVEVASGSVCRPCLRCDEKTTLDDLCDLTVRHERVINVQVTGDEVEAGSLL